MSVRIANFRDVQVMEVGVNGPDGATRLFICSGTALGTVGAGATQRSAVTWKFLLGPTLRPGEFRKATAAASISVFTAAGFQELSICSWRIDSVDADWDDESGQVEVTLELVVDVSHTSWADIQAIGYQVAILAAV